MSKKLKIGLDLDGVIIDHVSNRILKSKELGYKIKPEETPTHIIKKILAAEDYQKLQKYVYSPASLSAPAMKGATEHIKRLARQNELFIISRRKIEDGGDKLGLKWLESKGLLNLIQKDKIVFVPHSQKNAKNIMAKTLGIEVYLDDQLKILKEISNVKYRVLFDQYGVYDSSPLFCTKVAGWPEFADFIRKLK